MPADPIPLPLQPAIVLVRPQLGENIGACARAMRNCGLSDLRLVEPRDGWPNERARAAATGAVALVDRARLYPNVPEAIADLSMIYATTARRRDMLKDAISLEEAVVELRKHRGQAGFLFGPERTGLDNDDLVLAGKVLHIPLDPTFQSLNLAQAVLLVSYEVFRQQNPGACHAASIAGDGDAPADDEEGRLATAAELQNLFEHLEHELDAASFFRVPEKRTAMLHSLRNALQRGGLRRHEAQLLHGVISSLTGHRMDGSPVRRKGSKTGARGPHQPD
jgi:tRNA/rRNA methyltransferase